MAGVFKSAMSYLGMADVSEADDEQEPEEPASFDHARPADSSLSRASSPAGSVTSPQSSGFGRSLSRITTIHPKSYDDAKTVGLAIRQGIPVVLNLSDVSESVAERIFDFSAGVVYGLRGSINKVTPRVFVFTPAQVSISDEEARPQAPNNDLFAD